MLLASFSLGDGRPRPGLILGEEILDLFVAPVGGYRFGKL